MHHETEGCLTPSDPADILGGITIQGVYKALKTHQISSEMNHSRRKMVLPLGVRKLLLERGFQYPKQIISFQMVKGGVGKTTLSYVLGMRASHYGAKVLVIDLDQQANLTRSFGYNVRESSVWVDIIQNKVPIEDTIIQCSETLHLIPSNFRNSRLDVELAHFSYNLRESVRNILSKLQDQYDLIIFDCPPTFNKTTLSVTCASDMVIIPLVPDPYAMDGLEFTFAELERNKDEFKLDLEIKILWNRYNIKERLSPHFMHTLASQKDKVNNILPIVVRADPSLKNLIFDIESVFNLPKRTAIREDFDHFAREILRINHWIEQQKGTSQIREG